MVHPRKVRIICLLALAAGLLGLSATAAGEGALVWTYQTEGPISSSPVIAADGTVYIISASYTSSDYTLYALDPAGNRKWSYEAGFYLSSPALGSDGTVYFGSYDKSLYAVDGETGNVKWSFQTGGGEIPASPVVTDAGSILCASSDGSLYSIDVDGNEEWSYSVGEGIRSSPAIGADGTIYFGTDGAKLYALAPDGTLRWEFDADVEVLSSPAIGADGTVYFGTVSGALYALDPAGELQWRFEAGGRIFSSPAIGSDGTVYFGCFDENLYALSPAGNLRWTFATYGLGFSSPAIGGDGKLYVGSDDNFIYAVSQDGALIWEYQTGGLASVCSPTIGNGVVYAGSDDGMVYCLGAEGTDRSPWPMLNHDPQRTGRASGGEVASQPSPQPASQPSIAKLVEIAYDDGVAETSLGFSAAGMGWAVRFTPPAGGATLKSVKYYIAGFQGDPSPIEVHVWDRNHQDLITPFEATPTKAGWFEVDLSQYGLRFTDDFYAGYTQVWGNSYPWIGYDTSGDSDRSYYADDWSPALPAGSSVMIRVVMQME